MNSLIKKLTQKSEHNLEVLKGGSGSGNFGHAGIPGHVGGSSSSHGATISGFIADFGEYSAEKLNTLIKKMERKYPKFYEKLEEHLHAATPGEEIGSGGEFLKESDIPDEIKALTQWDLQGRLKNSDSVRLYHGWFESRRGINNQISAEELNQKLDEGILKGTMSYTSNPESAYGFSENVGPVISSIIPFKNVLLSHFVVPRIREVWTEEFEFIIKPSKDNLNQAVDPDKFYKNQVKNNTIKPSGVYGYKGPKFKDTFEGLK